MSHVVLLGDSIFDNAAYTAGAPAVVDHLRAALAATWKATLLAVDRDTTEMVAVRLRGLPADAEYLVVSVGGNDALRHIHLLQAATTTSCPRWPPPATRSPPPTGPCSTRSWVSASRRPSGPCTTPSPD